MRAGSFLRVGGLALLAVGIALLLAFFGFANNPDNTIGDLGLLVLLLGGLVLAAGSAGMRLQPRNGQSQFAIIGWPLLSVGLVVALAGFLLESQTGCLCGAHGCTCGLAQYWLMIGEGLVAASSGIAFITLGALWGRRGASVRQGGGGPRAGSSPTGAPARPNDIKNPP